jgi:hypothetical protein
MRRRGSELATGEPVKNSEARNSEEQCGIVKSSEEEKQWGRVRTKTSGEQ